MECPEGVEGAGANNAGAVGEDEQQDGVLLVDCGIVVEDGGAGEEERRKKEEEEEERREREREEKRMQEDREDTAAVSCVYNFACVRACLCVCVYVCVSACVRACVRACDKSLAVFQVTVQCGIRGCLARRFVAGVSALSACARSFQPPFLAPSRSGLLFPHCTVFLVDLSSSHSLPPLTPNPSLPLFSCV